MIRSQDNLFLVCLDWETEDSSSTSLAVLLVVFLNGQLDLDFHDAMWIDYENANMLS